MRFDDESAIMRHALTLAARGEGLVEPNPMVGAVIVDEDRRLLGEGFHERFGGPHAEVNALAQAGERARGATLFVTLEPCCHHGKTPPCSRAVIDAGIRRVVVCAIDPSPQVAGGGIAELRDAGIDVEVGLCADEGTKLIAPFTMLNSRGRPFVIAKWAMTLDGKLASRTGDSRWISNPASRDIVHRLRGRVDAIAVGIGTALADDPLLTARPPGLRTPLRIVIDSQARLPLDSQLVRTAQQTPLLLATTDGIPASRLKQLHDAGVETMILSAANERVDLGGFLRELGKRNVTNLLFEGGGALFGVLFDLGVIDEVHAFIAPKLIGGTDAPSPILGEGRAMMSEALKLVEPEIRLLGDNVYMRGRTW